MKGSKMFKLFFPLILVLSFLAVPEAQAQNGSVTIPSTASDTSTATTGQTATPPPTTSNWSVTDVESLSLVSHNFTTGATTSGPTLGVGVALKYSGYSVPLGGAFVVNWAFGTDNTQSLFGLGLLAQVQNFVIGPGILWYDKTPQYTLNFGGSTSLF